MAYARFGSSDVYVYMNVGGYLSCCGCSLGESWDHFSTQSMVDHLAEHRAAGHQMPDNLEQRLWEDDEENFPPQCAEGHTWGESFHPYPDHEWLFIREITRRKCVKCGWEE